MTRRELLCFLLLRLSICYPKVLTIWTFLADRVGSERLNLKPFIFIAFCLVILHFLFLKVEDVYLNSNESLVYFRLIYLKARQLEDTYRHSATRDGTQRRWTFFVLMIGQRENQSVLLFIELCTLLWKDIIFHCSSCMPNLHSACMDQIKKKVLGCLLLFYFVVYNEILCMKTFFQLTYWLCGRSWGLRCLGAVLTQSPVAKQSFIKRTTWEQQISPFSPSSPHFSNNDLSKVRGLHIQQMCLSALYKSILPNLDWIRVTFLSGKCRIPQGNLFPILCLVTVKYLNPAAQIYLCTFCLSAFWSFRPLIHWFRVRYHTFQIYSLMA